MKFALFVHEAGSYASVSALADDLEASIASKGERDPFVYEGREALLLTLSFATERGRMGGYAIVIAGRAAAKGEAGEAGYVLLGRSAEGEVERWADFILSCLDCFSIDRAAKRSPGPLSQYLLAYPARRAETRKVLFGDSTIDLPYSAEEASQVLDTAGREFRVLAAYGDETTPWQAAWARCYRMIYKESARRLDRFVAAVDPLLPEDPTEAARFLLKWVQGWKYDRGPEALDFIDPLTAVTESRGDCDTRAVVMAIILKRRGIDTILMLSRDYEHAVAGIDVPGGGQRFPFAGKDWLVAETTAVKGIVGGKETTIGLGMIAADQNDWKKWLGVRLGD